MELWVFSSCAAILAVLLIRFCFGDRMKAGLRYALWLIVLLRLLIPVQIGQSAVSAEYLYRAVPMWNAQAQEVIVRDMTLSKYDHLEPDLRELMIEHLDNQESNPYETPTEWFSSRKIEILSVLYRIWLGGTVLFGVVFLYLNLRLYVRLRRSRVRLDVPDVRAAVYHSDAISSPCLFGFPIPAIYVTSQTVLDESELLLTEDEGELRHVLAHERAHIRHGDHVFAVLRCVCLALHWYNPLVWAAAFLAQEDSELACDAAAVKHLGDGERYAYGRTLLALSDPRKRRLHAFRGVISAAADAVSPAKQQITERIHALAARNRTVAAVGCLAVLLGVFLTVSGFSGVRDVQMARDVDAPRYVMEEARLWLEDMKTEDIRDAAESRQQFDDGSLKMTVGFAQTTVTDRQIVSLDYVKNTEPVRGREIEIWHMTVKSYCDYYRGLVLRFDDSFTDGSGWMFHTPYYLVFDAEEKTLISRYESRDPHYVPTDENSRWGTGLYHDDFSEELVYRLRFYDKFDGTERELRRVGAVSLLTVRSIASGNARDPYHYVDDVCYKVEYVSSSEHHRFGEEQLWRVIVNETGKVCGYAVYYPDHDDIAISDGRGGLQ